MGKSLAQGSRVLVTGATGYTGQVLVKRLLDAGSSVRAIARNASDLTPLAGLDVEWVRGEVYDPDCIQEAMAGMQYVFHVAAAFREAKSSRQDYWNVHVRSTELLCNEAIKQPDFQRFVHVSTVGVHGHIADPPGDENSSFGPGDDYQETKAEAETKLVAFAAKHTLPYSIIRPCAIYGPGEKRLLKLFKMATKPYFPILGKGKCWYHLVHVEDLVGAMMLAAVEEKALGQAFIAGASKPIQLEDMAKIMARTYNNRLKILRLPITPFFILGDLCELLCKPFKIEPPLYRRRVAFYSKDRNFTPGKMQQVLGYQPVYDNETGIIETAKWYKKHGWL
ncbi:MAG: NAD-dependent epimerase/dehydratase family protein [Candidatus Electrothrix sp. MAN1_4]|nr:NAD-dependent epimerase/dehydratase family protein [Candidatus Electrothrix sp. MAN1_4]